MDGVLALALDSLDSDVGGAVPFDDVQNCCTPGLDCDGTVNTGVCPPIEASSIRK